VNVFSGFPIPVPVPVPTAERIPGGLDADMRRVANPVADFFSREAGRPSTRPLPMLKITVEGEYIWVEGWSAGSMFQLRRLSQIMEPEPGNPLEAEGDLNSAAVRGPDGGLYLFPRLVARDKLAWHALTCRISCRREESPTCRRERFDATDFVNMFEDNAEAGGSAVKAESGALIVTGSNGRIGDAVMRRFAGRFEDVVGFDRKAPDPPPPGCTAVAVDITSDESVREALSMIREHHGALVASVIHLAAYYDFFGEPSDMYEKVTVGGTRRLLRGLRDAGLQVEQFVFSSTMLVHRPGEPGQFINEDWPIEPTWAYPESKVRTEQVIRDERGDSPAVLLRISGVYDDLCHSIPLAHQIQRIHDRKLTSRIYSGSTAHGQSFLHLDDLVDAIVLVVERRAQLPPELPLLLGEPEALSYDELQHTFARLIHGEELETFEVPGALAPLAKAGTWVIGKLPGGDPFVKPWMIDRANDHYALDITRARTLLGWQPQRSLRGTIPKMIAALKSDLPGFYRENDLELPSEVRKPEEAPPERGGPDDA